MTDSKDPLDCPRCGERRGASYSWWQWTLVILLFPLGFFAFATGKTPHRCEKCGYPDEPGAPPKRRGVRAFLRAKAEARDPGFKILFVALAGLFGIAALFPGVMAFREARWVSRSDLTEVSGPLGVAMRRERFITRTETAGTGRNRTSRTYKERIEWYEFHLAGDTAVYELRPTNACYRCDTLEQADERGKRLLLRVHKDDLAAARTDTLGGAVPLFGLESESEVHLGVTHGIFLANLGSTLMVTAAIGLALLALWFLSLYRVASSPAAGRSPFV